MLPKIDEKETKENAHRFLKGYRSISRYANAEQTIQSPEWSFLPRSNTGTTSKTLENHVANKEAMTSLKEPIDKAIHTLSSENQRLLSKRYLDREEWTDVQIYQNLNISKSAFYRKIGKALIAFAQAYGCGLLVTKEIEPFRNDNRTI